MHILLSLFALFSLSSRADTLKLNQAITEALSDSPTLQKSQAIVDEMSWKKTEEFSSFLPHLRANGTYLTDVKYQYINVQLAGNPEPVTFPSIVPNSQFNLIAELSIFDGFSSTNKFQAAKAKENAARAEYDWARLNKEIEVTLAFYQAVASKTLKEVAEQNVKALKDNLREVEILKKNGASTHYDVLKASVQLSNANSALLDSEDNIEISYEQLAQVLGHEKETRDLSGELPVPSIDLIKKMKNENLNERKDVQALRLERDSAEYERKADAKFWVPQVSIFAQHSFYNNLTTGLDDYESYRNSRQIGLSLTWNLFDGVKSYSQSQQSIAQKIQVEKDLVERELNAKKDIARWERKYQYFYQLYQAKVEDVEMAAESVRLAQAGHKVGARTNRDLLEAQADLYNSRAGKIRAQLGAIEALLKYKLSLGK
jgi:outer membrane protein TolC